MYITEPFALGQWDHYDCGLLGCAIMQCGGYISTFRRNLLNHLQCRSSSQTLEHMYQNTRCHIPEDCHEIIISHKVI
jgi:hypothetical protein